MRVMVLVKADESSEAGEMPSEELITAMMNFNEELASAGLLIDGEGLHPSSRGVRIRFPGSDRTVTEGAPSKPRTRSSPVVGSGKFLRWKK